MTYALSDPTMSATVDGLVFVIPGSVILWPTPTAR